MENHFSLTYYDYAIAPERIAQEPVSLRDASRLLVVERAKNSFQEYVFSDILSMLEPGDVLVLNDTRVIKARLLGRREGGGAIEVLLLRERSPDSWEVLVKPGKRARVGERIIFGEGELTATIIESTSEGGRLLQFPHGLLRQHLATIGKVPTPPYIKQDVKDPAQYQTVYAQKEGAVAAPTAGLHFTPRLLDHIQEKGVHLCYVTLHCGLSTFRPIKCDDIRDHSMLPEWIEISQAAAEMINNAKEGGRRVIAVGTTSVRTLESVAVDSGKGVLCVRPFLGETNIYLVPGYRFRIVDALITNFHTPCSTNLVLAAAFCGYDLLMAAYQGAMKDHFRFFSFGDAMFIR